MLQQAISYVTIEPAEIDAWRDAIVDVYRLAFRPPPYGKGENVVSQFKSSFAKHAGYEGFRCVAALAGGHDLCGFIYGYTGQSGQWWYEQIVAQIDSATREKWFEDAFEVVELAVRPAMQGRGIGGGLHDRLLPAAPNRTAVLSTLDAETRGLQLYRKRGWQVICSRFQFSGVPEPYLIMGLELERLRKDP